MPKTNRPLKVFLCHAHSDKDIVRALYDRLVKDGVNAWLDKAILLPGQDWELEIRTAVREADVVVVCLSKEFNKAGFRQKEVRIALDTAMEQQEGEIFIIPARLEESDTLESLRKWHWVDLFEDDGYEMLMRALRVRADSIGATLQARRSWLSKVSAPIAKSGKPNVEEAPDMSKEKELQQVKKQEPPVENITLKSRTTDKPRKDLFKLKSEYVVAIIGAIATIIAAVIGLPLIERLFSQTPEPAATATIQIQVSPTELLVPVIATKTLLPTLTPTKAFMPAPTPFPLETTDSKGVEMVLVPEGEFTMGSNDGDRDEKPVHQVYLDAYYIDKYKVTNALYLVCIDEGVCSPPMYTMRYRNSTYAQHPVVEVNWDMAKTYCEWRGARLPTEAEWEKAARGTDGRTYPWGEEINCDYANYQDGDKHCVGGTTNVGSYPRGISPYGAYDMAGNVWEWVADWYDENYYAISPDVNPLGPKNGDSRVLRGGTWFELKFNLRSAFRVGYNSTLYYSVIGFRCARSP